MNEEAAVWYLPGDDNQPAGPYSTRTVLDGLKSGQLVPSVLCWREGMADWQPLAAVEPFARELARRRAAAKKRVMRVVVGVVVVVCLLAAGVVAYLVVMGPPEVRRARKLISAGLHNEASQVLAPYLAQEPLDHQARYLLAIAQINAYAGGSAGGGTIRSLTWGVQSLGEAKANLSQALAAEPGLAQKAREDVAAAVARIPPGAADSFARILALARLRAELNLAEKPALAAELMASMASVGGAGRSGLLGNQGVMLQVLEWDPSLSGRIVESVLTGPSDSPQDLRMAMSLLQRWARQRPALAEPIASQLMSKALSLYEAGHRAEAKLVLQSVMALDPKPAATQEHALLAIRLMDADDAKLTRCQLFLSKFPDSPHRSEVQFTVLKDAVDVFDRQGRWYRNRSQPYLTAGLSAARELLEKWPQTPELDVRVFELARRMAQNNQQGDALELTDALLAVMAETPIKLQIDESRAQWRVSTGIGTLPPEFETLAEKVSKELNIHDLTMPATLRTLADAPDTVHVIRVTDGCTLDKFNSDEKEMLRQWVGNGGFLWANNDVLSLFGVQLGASRWPPSGVQECWPPLTPELCPIPTGCERVVVSKKRLAAYNLTHPTANVIPLLTTEYYEEKYAYWSLVPYGSGYVSDVKTVDKTKYDGARFWLNFQLFCLGQPIPGAPAVRSYDGLGALAQPGQAAEPQRRAETLASAEPATQLPARIVSLEALKKSLAAGGPGGILWVALPREQTDDEARDALQRWVHRGGVLWIETDLAALFGFGGLRRDSSLPVSGSAQVTSFSHPLIGNLAGATVAYERGANGLVLIGEAAAIQRGEILPLLFLPATASGEFRLVCASCPCGEGFSIFRPKDIEGPGPFAGGASFETNLLKFSGSPSKAGWPSLDSRRNLRRRPPTGRRRFPR